MGQAESFFLGNKQEGNNELDSNNQSKGNSILEVNREIEDTDNETKFKKVLQHFSLISHNHKDPYLGEVEVFKCNHNKSFRIFLREMFTKSDEELMEQIEMWTRRMQELKQPNIIQLHVNSIQCLACCHSKVESFCATFYKVYLIFDSIETDLLTQIRTERIQGFSEDDLWFMLDSLVGALEFMQEHDLSHSALRLDTIYITINHKNVKLFKLADSQLMGYTSNYHQQLTSPDKYIYLSPQLYKQIGNTIENPVHDEYKSDVFTLGLIFIHLALFESCTDLYIQSDFSINSRALEQKLQKMKENYSPEFVGIIEEMVCLDEKTRPDFRTLDRQLSSSPKLFGRRICEMLEVPELYKMKPLSFMNELEVQKKKDEEIKKKMAKEAQKQEQKELTEKEVLMKAIQSQDALNIIKESLAKTSYLTEQVFRQSQRADVQFQVDNVMLPANLRVNTDINSQPAQQQSSINFLTQQLKNLIPESPFPQTQNANMVLPYSEMNIMQANQQQVPSQKLKNFEIPFTTHQPQANNMNLMQTPSQPQQLIDNQLVIEKREPANPNAQNFSPEQRNSIQMITNTSKKLQQENPELSRIIQKNLVRQTIKYNNGNIYEGDILDGKKHGYGAFLFSNSQRYEGEWQNNKRHGKGTQFYSDSSVKYEGNWSDDVYSGFGTLFNKETKVQQINQMQIPVSYQDLSVLGEFWIKYEGDFINGQKHGFGTITFANFDQFIGSFNNGKANGVGNYVFADSDKCVSGEWKNNVLVKEYM